MTLSSKPVQRTVTRHKSSNGYRTERTDFVDNAARIEAANSLSLQSGRDVNSIGSLIICLAGKR